jgi:hypothetical protein
MSGNNEREIEYLRGVGFIYTRRKGRKLWETFQGTRSGLTGKISTLSIFVNGTDKMALYPIGSLPYGTANSISSSQLFFLL